MYEEWFRRRKHLLSAASSSRRSGGNGDLRAHSPIDIAEARRASDGNAVTPTIVPTNGGRALSQRLVSDETVEPVCREQYRCLAASLHQLHPEGLSVLMVASAMPGEGKTLTAANLALTLSQSYAREVLLIDADLRRPFLHEVFGIANDEGLSEFLAGPPERKLSVHQVAPRLSLVPAGAATSDPMSRLTSLRMRRVFAQAPESSDWVIVDTPAIDILPDAGLLASMVDGVLLVVSARSTAYALVKRAIDAIGRTRIVGVVLNRVDPGVLRSQAGQFERYYSQPAGK